MNHKLRVGIYGTNGHQIHGLLKKHPDAYLDMYIDTLKGRGNMPLTLEDEIHPLRMAIRAKIKAMKF